MKSLWNNREAARCRGDLALRVYTSRLLGRDKSLVLHGGGNTSVKVRERDILGGEEELLYIKGSGWDLETIEEAGFAPVRMEYLLGLATLKTMSDAQMSNELLTHMKRASAPAPSVETILHALLPHKFVDHTHADAFIAVSNTKDGSRRIREIYGDSLVYIPYVMPGFDLARACARLFPKHATGRTIGMALEHHGLFSFGTTAKESYERMITLVARAEDYLRRKKAWKIAIPAVKKETGKPIRHEIALLRREIAAAAGFPVLLMTETDAATRAFARRAVATSIARQGPATPDHVIRTKRVPLIGRDVAAYVKAYQFYFERHAAKAAQPLTMLDPAPRVVLDPEFGMATVGRSAKDARIVADIYRRTIDIIQRAERLGGWQVLPAGDIFDVEYWELEQAKLRKGGRAPVFAGEVVLVTGAASGIGKASVDSFLARGAAVVGLDLNPAIRQARKEAAFLGIRCDLTDERAVRSALEEATRRFGGLDMAVLNAGIFPPSCRIEDLDGAFWKKVMGINLDSNLALMRETHPLLKLAPKGGRMVIVGSKNVRAPGPGVAAYSASKAAVNQLARVAALEWGRDNIRVNTIHPNAVFDTGIWSKEVLASRARDYGMTVAEYKTNNLLKVEVLSQDVAELAAEMCGPLFAKTTGAQVPIDGGNERVI